MATALRYFLLAAFLEVLWQGRSEGRGLLGAVGADSQGYGYGGYYGYYGPASYGGYAGLPSASPMVPPGTAPTLSQPTQYANLAEVFANVPGTSDIGWILDLMQTDPRIGVFVKAVLKLPFTLVVPTNQAFTNWRAKYNLTFEEISKWSGQDKARVVVPHLVPNRRYTSANMTDGFTFQTGLPLFNLAGALITVSREPGPNGRITLTTAGGTVHHVLRTDILVGSGPTQGVVHLIDISIDEEEEPEEEGFGGGDSPPEEEGFGGGDSPPEEER